MKEDLLISKSRVRLFLKRNGVRVSRELCRELDTELREFLLKAVKRANRNNRSTLMPQDL